MDLSKFDNAWYKPGNPLKIRLWYYTNTMFFKSYWFPLSSLKIFLLRMFGAKVGKGIVIKPGVNIKYPWLLSIGDYSWIGEGVWLDNLARIDIGMSVCISQGAMLLCGNHDYTKETFDLIVKPIVLEDEVWIGAQSVVCPGIKCQKGAVLAVASVATKNLEQNTIYQGNPAVPVRLRIK